MLSGFGSGFPKYPLMVHGTEGAKSP
jgi:hypothetical protein